MSRKTDHVVGLQLGGMAESFIEFGILDQGRMINRHWPTSEVSPQFLQWLKFKNARGAHIYVRPYVPSGQSSGLLLLDDLPSAGLGRLRESGLEPSIITETSPNNYQAWIRMMKETMAPERGTAVARAMCVAFGADPHSADYRHYGRLAGFTNRKPEYQNRGLFPFVRLVHSKPIVASRADEWLSRVPVQTPRSPTRETHVHHGRDLIYSELAQPFYDRCTGPIDQSRIDFGIARHLIQKGIVLEVITNVLSESPGIEQRHKGQVAKYIERTIAKAKGVSHV